MTTLRNSAIELCTIFVAKAIKDTTQQESMFWWKGDALLSLTAIQEQLSILSRVENIAFALAITDSICRIAATLCEHTGDSDSAGIAIVIEELQAMLHKDHETEKQEREKRLSLVPFKPNRRRKAS